MNVYIAGYNIDASVIDEFKAAQPERQDITPETLSASYARISRDPRPINELRVAARQEVEKARKSNENIIFGLGHSSVAEHAVFNLDIINISRLAMETLERGRLCSYTEKSQRYITLGKDFLIPAEIKGTALEKKFTDLIDAQTIAYNELFEVLKDYVYTANPALAADPKNKNLLEGWAKEDARYITSLATYSQAGVTLNARNLEKLLRRLSASDTQELRDLGKEIHTLVYPLAPSIVKYPEAKEFEKLTYKDLAKHTLHKESHDPVVVLHQYTQNADTNILAAMLFATGQASYTDCRSKVAAMSNEQKLAILKDATQHMKLYDQVIREFEMAELTFEVTLSAACFGQLKRHRMATVIAQDYDPALGLVIPPNVNAVGKAKIFEDIAAQATALYNEIKKVAPQAADYALINAQQRKVIYKTNLRALYHLSRLREDAHAQWDIRTISQLMVAEAKKAMPITTALIGGKDVFAQLTKAAFAV